ncbi:MAG: FliA/WhiG family RNA polymerase sigma factor [Eubacteriales bacterium]|nr:FliA/WhiG family RNA polymerase sigma factor [Eubacteriales bacterium]MDD3349967.1 FliA/WhiG family RNA polymerase sigma factor [Eubacteriales bacterium]
MNPGEKEKADFGQTELEETEKTDSEFYIAQWKTYLADRSIESRNEIVLQYTDLVRKIVLRFKGSYNNFGQIDDLVNQGMIALIDAVEKFDPLLGNKFETFASLKVKGAVVDYMRKQDWVPRNQRNLAKELDEVYSELYANTGCAPSNAEMAEKMGITTVQLEKILQQRHNSILLSYEEAINEQMMVASPLRETQNDEGSPESQILHLELKEKLVEAIDQLNAKEKQVVSLYYYESLKLKEIAEILGITESRVSQIHSASMIKMKHILEKY